ncbi:MAG TPA: HAD family phosphatase, partial [Bacteroidia bacterium]|nr:HAD family phosphatase [Bacteroidia bacterium]
MQGIKNVIFDLGGVIINLDVNKTIVEFNKLSKIPFEQIYTQKQQTDLFNAIDKGEISEKDFFTEIAKQIQFDGSHDKLL